MSPAIGANSYQPFDMTVQVWKQALGQVDRLSTGVWDTIKKVAHIAFALLLTPGVLFFDLVVSVITVVKWCSRKSNSPSQPPAYQPPPSYNPAVVGERYLPAPSAPLLRANQVLPNQEMVAYEFALLKQALQEAYAQLQETYQIDKKPFYQDLIDNHGTPIAEEANLPIHQWIARCYLVYFLRHKGEIDPIPYCLIESRREVNPMIESLFLSLSRLSETHKETLFMSLIDLEKDEELAGIRRICKLEIDRWALILTQHRPFLNLCMQLESRNRNN